MLTVVDLWISTENSAADFQISLSLLTRRFLIKVLFFCIYFVWYRRHFFVLCGQKPSYSQLVSRTKNSQREPVSENMEKFKASVLEALKKNWVPVSAATLLSVYIAYKKGWLKLKYFIFAAVCALLAKYAQSYLLKQGRKPSKKPSSDTSKTIETFEDATAYVSGCDGLSQEQQLRFYGLFKQATKGDCTTKRPSPFAFVCWRHVLTVLSTNCFIVLF